MSKGIRQLDGRVAVITGAASGIGRALARALANKGCRLALVDVDQPGLTMLQEELSELNSDRVVSTHVADVADANRMREVAREVATGHRAVHLLINNAGITHESPFPQTSLAEWERIIGVNRRGDNLFGNCPASNLTQVSLVTKQADAATMKRPARSVSCG